MRAFYERNKKAVFDLIILIAAILFCFLFFRYLFPIFLPFLIGWLLSLLFCPLADRLENHGVPRGIGALLGQNVPLNYSYYNTFWTEKNPFFEILKNLK